MTATPTRRAPGASRTHTAALRGRALFPVELQRHFLVGRQGIEPWTRGLKVRRSAIELTAHGRWQSLFS